MRRRIEALAERLEEFVSEDGHDALVVRCAEAGVGLVGAALDLTQQRGSVDVSVPLFDRFESAEASAQALLAWVETFTRDAGLAPLALASAPVVDRAIDALAQLARAVRTRGDVRVALWLCPSAIDDEQAYLALALALTAAARRVDPPLRVALRDLPDGGLTEALARAAVPVLHVAVDTSSEAVRDALAEEAADPAHDPSVRAAALLSVALADAAAGRAEEALPVLTTLARTFEALGDASSRALCFVAIGSALVQFGHLDRARERVSQGLAIAVEARAVAVVISGGMLAGQLSMRANDAADADVRFDVVARLAARVGAPQIVAEALIERGKALAAQGRARAACDAWTCAAEAARRAHSAIHERTALSAIADLYRDAGMTREAAPLERRIRALDGAAHAGCAHAHAS